MRAASGMPMAPLPLLAPDWPAPPRVRAAMTTRVGGISAAPYASLNLGLRCGDDSAAVAENRRRVAVTLDLPGAPCWMSQVHGAQVVRLPQAGAEPEADASWTQTPGVVCAVQSADCLPVLFCDERGTLVAAAHAGWRGLAAGVLTATVRALPVDPGSLMAWLGAAIGPDAFEVGGEVREAFVAGDPGAAAHFETAASLAKYCADLYGLARRQLTATGVTRVYGGGHCTYKESDRFFSYRRDGRTGRMAALAWLAA